MEKPVLEIDGNDFDTIEEFWDEVSRVLVPGVAWGRNMDAFNDILRGGFGTPDGGFVLRWKNSDRSRRNLKYRDELIFEELVAIVRNHGPGGEESTDAVELVLD